MEMENLKRIVNYIREEVIDQKRTLEELKNELEEKFGIKSSDIEKVENYILLKTNIITQENKEVRVSFTNFYIVIQNDIVKCMVLEQEYKGIVSDSVKQKYYYDKENELFVSTVEFKTPMLFSMNFETMIKYNGEFIYQDRYTTKEEAEEFNDKIFNQIVKGEKTIIEIVEECNEEETEEMEEEQ